MKFNVVLTRADTVSSYGSFYDCPSKNTFLLKKDKDDLKWLPYRTKTPNTKAFIKLGGRYGIIHIPHEDNLFSFEATKICLLNEIELNARKTRSSNNKFRLANEKRKLLESLRFQIKDFLRNEIIKLNISGECLISSDYFKYPARKLNLWKNDTSPYLEKTSFGMAFFQFENKKESSRYIEETSSIESDDWIPKTIVW